MSNTPKPSKCIENYAISTFAAAVGVHLGLKRLPTQSEMIYCGIFYIARRRRKHIFPMFWLGGQDTCLGGLCHPCPPLDPALHGTSRAMQRYYKWGWDPEPEESDPTPRNRNRCHYILELFSGTSF